MSAPDNTPVQADALVERLEAWADNDSQYGHHARAEDLYAAVAILAHQPTTDAEAEPAAWIWRYNAPGAEPELTMHDLRGCYGSNWTETPLYAHPPADKARIAELDWLEGQFQDYLRATENEFGAGDGSEYRAVEERAKRTFSALRAALKDAPHD